jgi:spore coat polysaccharide biosynthesis protein SpsF
MSPGAAIVLQARMGSARLPGKVLADLGGRPLLDHCVERLRARSRLPIILATTTKREDDCLAGHAERLGIAILRGPEHDVLARFALAVSTFGLTTIVRATADNPAVDLEAPGRTLAHLLSTGADHVVDDGLPSGSTVEAISAAALMRVAGLATDEYDREHVTPFLRRDRRFQAVTVAAPDPLRRPDLRLSVDTRDDLAFLRRILAIAERESARPVPLAHLIRAADRAVSPPAVDPHDDQRTAR